ncbi:hypothetical protein WICPIJ_005486 [Wickerhamomyces pijperi]|uniref:Uncharacterized protein n=1 Tax=Wickerhamomyces pijperi TaxID=599730 RepID=A0A9P8TLX8_WICPI|nr:hypothetical protein WICPIJ_005486 [Wickerhamomyces pijperi]
MTKIVVLVDVIEPFDRVIVRFVFGFRVHSDLKTIVALTDRDATSSFNVLWSMIPAILVRSLFDQIFQLGFQRFVITGIFDFLSVASQEAIIHTVISSSSSSSESSSSSPSSSSSSESISSSETNSPSEPMRISSSPSLKSEPISWWPSSSLVISTSSAISSSVASSSSSISATSYIPKVEFWNKSGVSSLKSFSSSSTSSSSASAPLADSEVLKSSWRVVLISPNLFKTPAMASKTKKYSL